MKLIIGLGNPGEEYINTRHNVGFAAIDLITAKAGTIFSFEKKFNADVAKAEFNGSQAILAKPRTFVNKTGDAVNKLRAFYKVNTEDVVLIHDDLDLDFGSFKISFAKESGGHNGVQSVIDHLGTNQFWRVRIGVANRKLQTARKQDTLEAKKEAVGDFVLTPFSKTEQKELEGIIKEALEKLAESLR